jgi:membrane protease YdiL (CAAX protease family)
VWFSLVTWLMVRTKNIWDCVAAHMITNLLLGLFVVIEGKHWHLM